MTRRYSDPYFDRGDDISELEERALGALEEAQALHEKLSAETEQLRAVLTEALCRLVKPGDILEGHSRDWGALRVMRGNARNARRYEVASAPTVVEIDVVRPELIRFRIEAYPLNTDGKRMSGRAGNSRNTHAQSDAVVLFGQICGALDFEDTRSANDILAAFVDRAARTGASQDAGQGGNGNGNR